MLSACTSAPVPKAISDSMDADSGLVLSSSKVEGWRIDETCRPHLCHLHKRLAITAPDGESMVVVVAPDEATGKPVAVGMRSRQWDDSSTPHSVATRIKRFIGFR